MPNSDPTTATQPDAMHSMTTPEPDALHSRTARQPDSDLRSLKWSAKEKAVARRAFDRALKLELDDVVREAKDRASRIEEASGLWELERWLTQRRQQIDREFDFRYSVLPYVFARLLRESRLIDDDFQGLSQDKLGLIRQLAAL